MTPNSTSLSSPRKALEFRQVMGRRPVQLVVVLVGVIGVLASGRAILGPSAPAEAESEAVARRVLPVTVVSAQLTNRYEVRRSFTGEIAPVRSSNIGFERAGTLVEVLVREGDLVSVDQPLARLDVRNLEAQRQRLLAQRDRAEAELSRLAEGARQENIDAAQAVVRDLEEQFRLQESQRERREFLFEEGAISREQLDEFAFGSAVLQARIDRAESELEELTNGSRPQDIAAQQAVVRQLDAEIADLEVTISKSTVRSPFDGIVATREIDEGTVVSAGQGVVEVLENARPEARIGLPSDVLDDLPLGNSVQVELAGQIRDARVEAVLPQVDSLTRTQEVVLALEDAAIGRASPGQTVELQLVEAIEAQGYWLPLSALTQGVRGLWNCYVIVPAAENSASEYEVRSQAVEILHQEGDRVLVRGTLQAGDRVVADGAHRMVPGQPVEIASDSDREIAQLSQ